MEAIRVSPNESQSRLNERLLKLSGTTEDVEAAHVASSLNEAEALATAKQGLDQANTGELARVCEANCDCQFCLKYFSEVPSVEEELHSGSGEDSENPEVNCLMPSHLMITTIEYEDTKLEALLDSGCSSSVIRESCVRGEIEPLRSKVIRGLDNIQIQPVGQANVKFYIQEMEFETKFIVVPDASIRYSAILGNNFFREEKVVLDLANHRISGGTKGGRWDFYTDIPGRGFMHRGIPVVLTEDVKIKPGETTLVNARIDTSGMRRDLSLGDMFFEPSSELRDIQGIPGEIDVCEGQLKVLLSREFVSKPEVKVLHKNTQVGTLATFVDVTAIETTDVPGNVIEELDLAHLGTTEAEKVRAVFREHVGVISTGDIDIGCAGVTEHRIELYDETPIRQRPRRFPGPVVDEVERQCEELLSKDIIEFSRSPWSSPIVPVRKKDGSLRVCIDYRRLNAVTKPDRFPMPLMNDLVFTTIDLVKGYYQIPMHPDSVECTAFSTTRNHYQFKRLSFGLRNAPSAFQREMQAVLKNFDTKNVVVFIDDIMIASRNFEEHLSLVSRVLTTLSNYGIKIKLSKCCWFKAEVPFLGHIVGQQGVRKCPKYMTAVVEYPRPKNVKELRSFVGMVNFQRKYIPNCSVMSKPLTIWLGKSDKILLQWTEEMEAAFAGLKEAMARDIELAYPDYSPDAPLMELATDASKHGAGAALTQEQNGSQRVIAYSSTTFNKAQSQYGAIELELSAIRWALSNLKCFLYGIPFVLYTDHNPLINMTNMAKQNARIMRTWNELSEFDFTIKYRAGRDMAIPDNLSRLHATEEENKGVILEKTLPDGLDGLDKVDGGGDSLVLSLWSVLDHYRKHVNPNVELPLTAHHLRTLLVNELLSHLEDYSLANDKLHRSLVKLSRLRGQPPPMEFCSVFSKLYNLQVWCISA